jgi:hypothetical protein
LSHRSLHETRDSRRDQMTRCVEEKSRKGRVGSGGGAGDRLSHFHTATPSRVLKEGCVASVMLTVVQALNIVSLR